MSISQTIKNHPSLEGVEPTDILDLLWEHDVIGVSLVDLEGRWIHPSPELCSWLGYTQGQLEKMTWMDITIRTDRKEDIEAVQNVVQGKLEKYSMFKTYVRRNSTLMPATLVVIPIKGSDNKVVMFLSQIMRDERDIGVPPVDELRVIWNFLVAHKKKATASAIGYTIAVALAGEGALRWLGQVLDSITTFT